MLWHGAGSHSSPIVIESDDEEEAYVEFALERRISSPDEFLDYDDIVVDASYEQRAHKVSLEERITEDLGGSHDGSAHPRIGVPTG